MIAAAKSQLTTKSRKRTLDYTRRHVVVALLAVGRSRAQAAKYVRISPEMLQRVAECNSRFRYDMQKAELDYQTRKARRRLKRSLVDHASPDAIEVKAAEEQRAAKAQAAAQAEAKATAARIKASLQSDAEAWVNVNPEGRSMFHGREEMPSLAELETLARSYPPLPALPEFQLPKFDLPPVNFDFEVSSGPQFGGSTPEPPAATAIQNAVGDEEELNSTANARSELTRPQSASPARLQPLIIAEKMRRFPGARRSRRVRIVTTAKQRPAKQRLRNSPNPPKPRIRNLHVVLPQRSANAAPEAPAARVRPQHPSAAAIDVAATDVITCLTQSTAKRRRGKVLVALRSCGAALQLGMLAGQMLLAVLHAVLRLARPPANRAASESSPQQPASELCRMLHPNVKRHRWEVTRRAARPRDGPVVGWRKRSTAAARLVRPP